MPRYTSTLSYATLTIGLMIVIVGLAVHSQPIRTGGLAMTVLGGTAVAVTQQRKAVQLSADQLADADRAGYMRCANHVARGLLDIPPVPTGHPHTAPPIATVHYLHTDPEHRKAQ